MTNSLPAREIYYTAARWNRKENDYGSAVIALKVRPRCRHNVVPAIAIGFEYCRDGCGYARRLPSPCPFCGHTEK